MRKALGYAQESALMALGKSGPAGCTFDDLYDLRGRAKSYSGTYLAGFEKVLKDHNQAVREDAHDTKCARNCPLGPVAVQGGSFGEAHGWRYRLATWDELARRGSTRSIKEWDLDTLKDGSTRDLWEAAHTPDFPLPAGIDLIAFRPWSYLVARNWVETRLVDVTRCADVITKLVSAQTIIKAVVAHPEVMRDVPECESFLMTHRQAFFQEACHAARTKAALYSRAEDELAHILQYAPVNLVSTRTRRLRIDTPDQRLIVAAGVLLGYLDNRLAELAHSTKGDLRTAVAHYAGTPSSILAELAQDSRLDVIRAVASNPNTPLDVLDKLVSHPEPFVRLSVAQNRSTPPEALVKLSNDPERRVSEAVAQHPNTPDTSAVWAAL